MDSRQPTKKNKYSYKELKSKLISMGYYEDGMQLIEMRQIVEALDKSTNEKERETSFSESETQQALKESKAIVDLSPQPGPSRSSTTMMSASLSASRSSIETPPENIVVRAQIHRSMDWSPSPHKRPAASGTAIDIPTIYIDEETSSEKLDERPSTSHSSQRAFKKFKESTTPPAPKESTAEANVSPQVFPILRSTLMSASLRTSPSIISMRPQNLAVQAQIPRSVTWSTSPQKLSAASGTETDIPSISLGVETGNEKSEEDKSSASPSLQQTYKKLDEEPSTSQSLQRTLKKLGRKIFKSPSGKIAYKKLEEESASYSLQVPYGKMKTEESYNSLQDVDSLELSGDSSVDVSAGNLPDIRSPISERITHDSGLIEDNATPQSPSSFTLTTSTPPSTASLSTHQSSPHSVHEIFGPISVRITHDSGLNLSPEAPAEHSNSSFENSENRSGEQKE